jgi:hypothetical protein
MTLGNATEVQKAAANLSAATSGPVFLPGDEGYDEERGGFQLFGQHLPTVVVRTHDDADVRAAVTFGAAHGLPVGVQSTGHAPAEPAEAGVLISTRQMSGVRVDPATHSAWLAAGVRWREVIDAAAPHGLAPLSGSAPHVGAIAYTLGGGIGLLARRHGYAADHVRSIDVVTADGRSRRVDVQHEPDLFWALRGGRDNFGIVTGLEIGLVPVPQFFGGGLYFATELIEDVTRQYLRWTATVPDEMSSSFAVIPFPPIPALPEPIRGRHVVHVRVAYLGDARSGDQLVAPLRAIGPRLIDSVGPMPYDQGGSIYSDPPGPMGYVGSNAMFDEFDESMLRVVLDLAGPAAQTPCILELRHLGGALGRPPAVANAVGHRHARYLLGALSRIGDDDSGARALQQKLMQAVAPWTTGRCLNFTYGSTTPEQVHATYDTDDLRRLSTIKAKYDPSNIFRLNQNIPPALGGA